ncbi:hypothetical protein [Chryseobacterium pennipullorum]|uniref:Lipoprotein n=1 Tax=Chryseobacterium pennipullorum TaxID=2258963 RepID=A0A3D9B8L1_9FLAO|nr:hypothetical protein [Chryseobacterium pennipullorum]REC49994.1 hypothetical protein DRF67_00145 [Chryseobacterium pennipullorum]
MKKHFAILAMAGTLTLLSCNAADKKTNAETTPVAADSKMVKIEFSGTENFTIKNPKLKVSLYGSDPTLADVPATLITEKEFEQTSVPFTIDLPVPNDAASKITPSSKGPAKYYVGVEWDSDGNGKANEKGDIFIDHDKQFPNVKLDGETQKVYLKVLK